MTAPPALPPGPSDRGPQGSGHDSQVRRSLGSASAGVEHLSGMFTAVRAAELISHPPGREIVAGGQWASNPEAGQVLLGD